MRVDMGICWDSVIDEGCDEAVCCYMAPLRCLLGTVDRVSSI